VTVPEAIPVTIIVDDRAVDDDDALRRVGDYARSLCDRLGLPVEVRVVVAETTPRGRVSIDGRIIAAPLRAAASVADGVAMCLYAGRECLVTDAVARAIAGQLDLTGVPFESLRRALRELVRCGRGVQRLRDASKRWPGMSPDEWLEAALSASGPPELRVEVPSADYARAVDADSGEYLPLPDADEDLGAMQAMMSDGLFYELGALFRTTFGPADDLEAATFRLTLNDIATPTLRGLGAGRYLVNDTAENLATTGIVAEATVNPANGQPAAIVTGEDTARLCIEEHGLTRWSAEGYLILAVSGELRANARAFCTTDTLEFALERLQQAFPDLVAAAVGRFDIEDLTRVCRALLAEELSIRDLRSLLEAMLEVQGTTTASNADYIVFGPKVGRVVPAREALPATALGTEQLVEVVRMSRRRYISHKYTRGQNTLLVYLLDPDIEKILYSAAADDLPPETRASILAALREELDSGHGAGARPVVLTTVDVRHRMRRLIEHEFPHLAVLSFQELSPDMNIQPIARVSLD
jgi:hypothetical protein